MTQEIFRCGCCDHYHRTGFYGDCRDDSERFTLEDLTAKFGAEDKGWTEVEHPDS